MSTNESTHDTTDTGTDAPSRPDASDEAATSPHEETWVYGGVRATRTGTRAHAWITRRPWRRIRPRNGHRACHEHRPDTTARLPVKTLKAPPRPP